MSLSWFFGSKKKHSEQEETTNTESQNNSFIFVERKVEEDKATSGLYPTLPYALAPQAEPTVLPKSSNASLSMNTNFLHQVPFILSQNATMEIISTLKKDINLVKSIQAYINFLDPNDFEYDFRLERGVLNENSS